MFWSPRLVSNDWLVIGPEYVSRGEVYYHGGCENAKVPWKIVLPRNGDVFYLDLSCTLYWFALWPELSIFVQIF